MDALRSVGTAVVLALLGASRVSGQTIKLSGALAPGLRAGNVTDYRFTPDGARMVYRADRSAVGLYELFSVPTDFSAPPVRLNGPLPAGGSVAGSASAGLSDFAIGAGNRVAYRADQTTVGTFELYSVPADGSEGPLRLSPALVRVSRLWLSPGGDEVFYSDQQSLHRVPLDGSSGPGLVARFPANEVLFSPHGSWAVLIQGADDDIDRQRLYSMRLDGSVPPLLLQLSDPSEAFVVGAQFEDVSFASDGAHILYNHDLYFEGESYIDLYSARLLSSGALARAPTAPPQPGRPLLDRPPTRLNLTRQAAEGFALDEDSPLDRVAYKESGVVFSASYDGARVPLSPPGWASDSDRIAVSGTDVVFGARTGAGNSVLRAPLDGSGSGVPLFAPAPLFPFVTQMEVV